jgi:DtxR family Mn-dependent transcriptional regulator
VNELVDTTEMYLRTILDLEEEGIAPLRARIVERLHHSGPTVSQTVARMERDGLLVVADNRRIELSDDGRRYAVRVMRKHRLAERLLTDVIGLDWSLVHTEACRWEHVISADVEQRLVAILDSPQESPYGNPIPGLDELSGPGSAADGAPDHPIALDQTLLTLAGAQPTAVAVRRIGELIQTDVQALEMIREAGVLPGSVLEVSATGRSVSVRPVPPGDGADRAPDRFAPVQLPRNIAAHVFATSVTAETPARHAFPGSPGQVPDDHVRHLAPSPAASGVVGSGGGTGPDAMAATVTVSR